MNGDGLQTCLLTAVIALEAWILLKIFDYNRIFEKHNQQIERLISDAESEKDTRSRTNNDFERRIRDIENKRQ